MESGLAHGRGGATLQLRLACSLVVVALLGLGAAPAARSAAEDPALREYAAEAYAQQHGVTEQEARRRLDVQDRAAGLPSDLRSILGDAYGGVWFASDDRGRIKVGVAEFDSPSTGARVEEAREALAERGVLDNADFVAVRSSMSDLESAQRALGRRLWGLQVAGRIRSGIDPSLNAIDLETSENLSRRDRAQVDSAAADARVSVRLRGSGKASLVATPEACNLPYCDRPLRGGVRIFATNQCTAGFMTRSRVGTQPYVMTAGHCVADDAGTWYTREADTTAHAIGTRHNWTFPGEADVGIVKLSSTSYWLTSTSPGPYVIVDASPDTTTDASYTITNEGFSSKGLFICRTSGFSFTGNEEYTRCGTVTHLNVTVTYPDGPVAHLGETDMCGVSGSSGGPYYKTHLAYGIHSGADPDACRTFYQGASGAENEMNVDILHG